MADNFEQDVLVTQKITGFWIIPELDKSKEYWGTVTYDPENGLSELSLIGFPISEDILKTKFDCVVGKGTNGKIITLFDLACTNWKTSGFEEKTNIVDFSVLNFTIGDIYFLSKDAVRLKSLSFRITNLEAWSGDHPLNPSFPKQHKKSIGTFSFPKGLLLYEDKLVKILISTIYHSNNSSLSITAFYEQIIEINAKNNRKLPYWGNTESFSFYLNIVHNFFSLTIGKCSVSFNFVGLVKKERINFDEIIKRTHNYRPPRRKRYYSQEVEFFQCMAVERKWLKRLDSSKILLPRVYIYGKEKQIFTSFFETHSVFGFVLNDWIGMRNCSLFNNYSLPELMYNLEGLHRNLFPELDTEPDEHKKSIWEVKALLSEEQVKFIDKEIHYHFSFRKRLHDIIVKRAAEFHPFLNRKNRDKIIEDLNNIRNNAAHSKNEDLYSWDYVFPLILFVEELIAILIFQQIGLSMEVIKKRFSALSEWAELKKMLCEELKIGAVK